MDGWTSTRSISSSTLIPSAAAHSTGLYTMSFGDVRIQVQRLGGPLQQVFGHAATASLILVQRTRLHVQLVSEILLVEPLEASQKGDRFPQMLVAEEHARILRTSRWESQLTKSRTKSGEKRGK